MVNITSFYCKVNSRNFVSYLLVILEAKYSNSILECQKCFVKSAEDGQPIFFKSIHDRHGCYSVFGGKTDYIFIAVLEGLDEKNF